MRQRFPAAFVLCVAVTNLLGARAGASDDALPAVLARVTSFHGHLSYRAYPVDDPSAVVNGTLTVGSADWALDERSGCCELHASDHGSWLRSGSHTLAFGDPLEVDALANSWAVLLATSLGSPMSRDPGGSSWVTNSGTRFYLDASMADVIGVADTNAASRVSFAYSDWMDVDGLRLPGSIVRMRGGIAERSFLIDEYQAQWAPQAVAVAGNAAAPAAAAMVSVAPPIPDALPLALRWLNIVFVLFVIALGIVAWTRRDALVDRIARRLASDPRAWRTSGVSIFVTPEGVLVFEGRPYRVGAIFFNRSVLVQTSALFIRVSAPGEARTLILARKFPVPASRPPVARRTAAGFTLIESLTASALFASVIVGAVFPTLVVLAHADRLAAQRQAALQIASNALTDEEAALAYGSHIEDNSLVSTVDGMTLTEMLTPAGVAGLHKLTVEVTDAKGQSLARIVTLIGPPVPAPGAPGPSPSPGTRG